VPIWQLLSGNLGVLPCSVIWHHQIWQDGGDLPYALPNFALSGPFLVIYDPKAPNVPSFANCPLNLQVNGDMCHYGLHKPFKFGAVWYVNKGFISKNCDKALSPQIFRAIAQKLSVRSKKVTGCNLCKNGTDILYLAKFGFDRQIWGGRRRTNKVFLFFVFFVTLLEVGMTHRSVPPFNKV